MEGEAVINDQLFFLGKPYSYWIEIQKRLDSHPDSMNVEHLLSELIVANAKVRYYEQQLDRMIEYKKAATK
ncbi:MAG TPA: hypothetical protein VF523_12915 [Burkholderiales bacterium]